MPSVAIISAFHDFRTAKRASIHQVAAGLVKLGYDVSFLSTRFSWLSRRTGDSRLPLWSKANRVEVVDGVHCLLWRTAIHPFHSGVSLIDRANGALYRPFAALPNRQFDRLLAGADYLIFESGIAALYIARARKLNPAAKIVYYAADRLSTVGAHPFIEHQLMESRSLIDHVILRARGMKDDFRWAENRLFKVGYGIDAKDFADVGPSPYRPDQLTAISVGSMLFDERFFQLAAPNFPQVEFHVIGCGTKFDAVENVRIHPEMPFSQTLPFVKHATIGVAPYRPIDGSDYLAESSLKLAQFAYFGLPAACPHFAAGSKPGRIGYEPFDEASIIKAVQSALDCAGQLAPQVFPTWQDVALQVIEPERGGAERID